MTSQSDFAGDLVFQGFSYEDGPLPLCAELVFKVDTDRDWDQDGVADTVDNCPVTAVAGQEDRDFDGHGDTCDHCPDYSSSNNFDTDENGIGDVCECGDQTGDGWVDVSDVAAINLAIYNPQLAKPLCDGNNDGRCNVSDIVAVNRRIFGQPAYCSRYPPPAAP